MRASTAIALLLTASCGPLSAAPPDRFPRAPGHWPQWRGPNRDAVSVETGLLAAWPPGGPPLLWTARGHGEGVSPATVAGGVIYLTGFQNGREWLSALDGDGIALWRRDVGPHSGEMAIMRYAVPRPLCVDEDRLYLLTAGGILRCSDSATGESRWSADYTRDYGGRRAVWGWGDYLFVEGDLLICTPGGSRGTVMALNKRTGVPVWRCIELKEASPDAALVPADIDGVRQLVVAHLNRVSGVDLKTGRLLWQAPRSARTAAPCAPVVREGVVLTAAGFGVGHQAYRVRRTEAGFEAKEIYSGRELAVQQGGLIAVGHHVFGSSDNGMLTCMEIATGRSVWQEKIGKGCLAAADGKLVWRLESHTKSEVRLIEAMGAGYRSLGGFELKGSELLRSHPVVTGGRLYLRDQDALSCFDLRGSGFESARDPWDILSRVTARSAAPEPGPAAPVTPAYVPTPRDVVEAMLSMAGTRVDDVVMDLGSGDGRIVIAASQRYRCRAVGLEIDQRLAAESRRAADLAGVASLVSIREEDLFKARLDEATLITLYLGEPANERLLPALRALQPGVRIVSHVHRLGTSGPPPDRTLQVVSLEDGAGHDLHLWTTPLR